MPYDSGMGSMSSLNTRALRALMGQAVPTGTITAGLGSKGMDAVNQLRDVVNAFTGSSMAPHMGAGDLSRMAGYADPPHPAPGMNANGGVGNTPYGPPVPAGAAGPMTYEQALAMARKMMGEAGIGGAADTAPIDAAIAAAQRDAANSTKQTKAQSARTQSDLAVLYGRLGNYVKGLLTGEQATNKTAETSVGSNFDKLIAQDKANSQSGQGQVSAELARLGMGDQASNVNANQQASLAHVLDMLNANKASTTGLMHTNNVAAENSLRDLQAGAATYGGSLVGRAKTEGQQAIDAIATALQNQLGQLNAQKGALRSQSGSQALDLAMKLLSQQGSNALNPLQQTEADKNVAETQKILADMMGSSQPGSIPAKQGLTAAEQWLQANAPQNHYSTLLNLLHTAEMGGATNNKVHYKFDPTDSGLLNAITDSINSRVGQGYNSDDLGTLLTAIRIAASKA